MYLSINRKTRSFFHFYIKKILRLRKDENVILESERERVEGREAFSKRTSGDPRARKHATRSPVKKYILFSECFGERHAQKYKNPI